jgi:hypothetical protein
MSGSLKVFKVIIFGSIWFESQVIIQMNEVFVDSMNQLITLLQTSIQSIVQIFIVVFFFGIFFC